MLRPDTFALTALLAAVTAIGPLSTDMYLPSLPDIARALSAPAAQVQLTLSAYLVGFAVGQIFYGRFPTGTAASRCFWRRSACSRWRP